MLSFGHCVPLELELLSFGLGVPLKLEQFEELVHALVELSDFIDLELGLAERTLLALARPLLDAFQVVVMTVVARQGDELRLAFFEVREANRALGVLRVPSRVVGARHVCQQLHLVLSSVENASVALPVGAIRSELDN